MKFFYIPIFNSILLSVDLFIPFFNNYNMINFLYKFVKYKIIEELLCYVTIIFNGKNFAILRLKSALALFLPFRLLSAILLEAHLSAPLV